MVKGDLYLDFFIEFLTCLVALFFLYHWVFFLNFTSEESAIKKLQQLKYFSIFNLRNLPCVKFLSWGVHLNFLYCNGEQFLHLTMLSISFFSSLLDTIKIKISFNINFLILFSNIFDMNKKQRSNYHFREDLTHKQTFSVFSIELR